MKLANEPIKRNDYWVLALLLPMAAGAAAEFLAILSSYSNSTYAIESLQTVMVLSEIALALLAAMLLASFYLKGRIGMYVLDVVRVAAVVLLCVCLYQVLAERATLMGYVWFSDLESGNLNSVNALNYGVASAALYAVAILLTAATGWIEFVTKRGKRTKEAIQAEIDALQKELKRLES